MYINEYLRHAMSQYSSGQFNKAKDIYIQILQVAPGNPFALHFYGLVVHKEGRTDAAIKLIKRALIQKPDYVEALYNLGIIFQKKNNLDDAIDAYSNAIKLNPDYANAYFKLSIVFATQGKYREAIGGFYRGLTLRPNYADAYFKLARIFGILGNFDYAILNYRKFLEMEPDQAEAYNNMGNALREQGKSKEAISSYEKALSINPNIQNARHFLNALTGNTSDRAPRDYVERIFNKYADRFEQHLVEKLSYQIPVMFKMKVNELGLSDKKFKNVIDLGCGTGLSGVQFRELSEHLIGVDLSKNMIQKAKEKNIYDELCIDDILENLNRTTSSFDLFICTDVLVYFGDLTPVFQSIKKRCHAKALFLFSTEHTDHDDFILNNKGRYAHSPNYIYSVSLNSGFRVLYSGQTDLRKEKDIWIMGSLYILQSV
jgi:predicted TPR repeat methyltransferase